jgi:hypothetical protein
MAATIYDADHETLVRRCKQWFGYDAPDKRLFKELRR